jgi:phage recombination protein Bet
MTTAMTVTQAATLSAEQVDLIKRTIAKGATDDELQLFLATAKRLGLDPFARQIFPVKRWDNRLRMEVMAIQTSIDGFRLIAERTGCYAPGRPTEYGMVDGKLQRATAYVKKFVHGAWHEIAEDAYWDEYVQTTKDGTVTSMWKRMPRVMLAKCAEARALRRAFPAELSGVYTADEMDQSERPEAPVVPIRRSGPWPPGLSEQTEPDHVQDAELVGEDGTLEKRMRACQTLGELGALVAELKAMPDGTFKSRLRAVYSEVRVGLLDPQQEVAP